MTEEHHLTAPTSHVNVISMGDVLVAVTEVQEAVGALQEAFNTIDNSPNSALGKQVALLNTSVNNFLINMNTLEARVTLVENAIKNLSVVQPISVVVDKPSFLSIIIKKFTNTWK
jgi:hypothetical protein